MRQLTFVLLSITLFLSACSPSGQEGASPAPEPEEPAAADVGASEAAPGFDQTMALQGVRFRVTCPNASSINEVTLEPTGLEIDNSPIVREVDGSVVGAEVADLNADGSPEVYVYVSSAGSGSYGSLVAYAANDKKSLSEIYLPPLEDDAEVSAGYMGHDEFSVVELSLGRRFPVYIEGDTNAEPTGGIRQLEYKLQPGEAGWVLRLHNVYNLEPSPPATD
jgi:hypothetical protein